MRLPMSVKPLDVETKGWEDNANKVTLAYL
jgi:hypothetical protein